MVAKDILVLPFLLVLCCMVSLSWSTNIEEETSEGFYEETVVLKTKIGSLRGHKEVVDFKTSYYAFKGIRYAKAPSGAKRFQVNQFVCFLMCCFLISIFFFFSLSHRKQRNLGRVFAMLYKTATFVLSSAFKQANQSVMKTVSQSTSTHLQYVNQVIKSELFSSS